MDNIYSAQWLLFFFFGGGGGEDGGGGILFVVPEQKCCYSCSGVPPPREVLPHRLSPSQVSGRKAADGNLSTFNPFANRLRFPFSFFLLLIPNVQIAVLYYCFPNKVQPFLPQKINDWRKGGGNSLVQ